MFVFFFDFIEVHEGAHLFCKTFLPEYHIHPQIHVAALCDALHKFMDLVREALNIHKQLIKTEQEKNFHYELEIGFAQLQAQIGFYLRGVPNFSSDEEDDDDDNDILSDTSTPSSTFTSPVKPKSKPKFSSPTLRSNIPRGRKRSQTTVEFATIAPTRSGSKHFTFDKIEIREDSFMAKKPKRKARMNKAKSVNQQDSF